MNDFMVVDKDPSKEEKKVTRFVAFKSNYKNQKIVGMMGSEQMTGVNEATISTVKRELHFLPVDVNVLKSGFHSEFYFI